MPVCGGVVKRLPLHRSRTSKLKTAGFQSPGHEGEREQSGDKGRVGERALWAADPPANVVCTGLVEVATVELITGG